MITFTVRSLLLLAIWSVAALGNAADITGAGATFPYPIYAKWADAYKTQTGIGLNYQSIGSGGGIKQIKASTVDFGASDMPLTPEELDKDGLFQFPAIVGGVVPIVNLDGIAPGQLRLNGRVLADIFLGIIKNWDDAAIAALNPDVKLPSTVITVVRRADGSGTTFVFTDYLSQVSKEWSSRVGQGTSVSWPTGVGGKGNEGVAAYVQRIKGAVGYVEFAYAKKNKMGYTQMLNRSGKYVQPDEDTFAAAATNARWDKAPGFYDLLTDQPGPDSWPMTAASFILLHTSAQDPAKTTAVLTFFSWAFKNGGKMASELDYVPMPPNVVKLIESAWQTKIKGPNGQAVWK